MANTVKGRINLKKPLISFLIAFGLTVGFSFLSLAIPASFSYSAFSNFALSLVEIGLFFAAFYLLANTSKITAGKSTTLALFFGVLLGSMVYVFLAWETAPFGLYWAFLLNALPYSISEFFLPAVTALLFAELRNKELNQSSTEESENESVT
jgi:hypothetical protein